MKNNRSHKFKVNINRILLLMDPNIVRAAMYITIIILLVCSIILTLIYFTARNQIVNIYTQLIRMKVEETKNQLNNQISSLQTALYELSTNSEVLMMARYSDFNKQQQVNIAMKIEKMISETLHANTIINNMYIHYPKQRLVIANGLYPEEKYNTLGKSERDKIQFLGFSMINKKDGNCPGIYITRELISGKEEGYLAAQINHKVIENLLEQIKIFNNEKIYIFNNNEELLYAIEHNNFEDSNNEYNEYINVLLQSNRDKNTQVDIYGKKYIAVYDESNLSGWTFIQIVPYNDVVKMSKPLKTTVITLLYIVILIGILLSIPVAMRIYEPLRRLYKMVRERFVHPEQVDRIQYLTSMFERLVNDNDQLRNIAKRNIPLLREKYLLQIVLQQSNDEKNLMEQLYSLGIKFNGKLFRVMVIYINDYIDMLGTMDYLKIEMYKEYLTENMRDMDSFYIVQFEPFKFFIVINYQDYLLQNFVEKMETIIDGFKHEFHIGIYVGISAEKKEIRSLHQAFMEAIQAYEYQLMMGNKPVGCYEYLNTNIVGQLNYPFVQDESLQYAIRTCDKEGIDRSINEIEKFIKVNTPTNVIALKLIFTNMYNNIHKLLYEMDDYPAKTDETTSKYLSMLIKSQSLNEQLIIIREFSIFVMECYYQANVRKKQEITLKIKQYIEIHYKEPLTVNDIASKFFISVSYLHRLLRDEMGISPAEYINQLRIKYAANELQLSSKSIMDIALECGFETKQAFYRQFKKRFLCTPSQYRERYQLRQN
ncbi:MAG: AraC family transcriptional regulator [Firmicutes bacterium]|nr:AraC family transcriptional regulator [Bacillota bacterium]